MADAKLINVLQAYEPFGRQLEEGRAFLNRFEDDATLGIIPQWQALAAAGLYRPEGMGFWEAYSAARAIDQQERAALAADNPKANLLGMAAGIGAGGLGAYRAAGALPGLATREAATRAGNVLRMAGAGAVAGGASNVTNRDLTDVYNQPGAVAREALTSAAVGGVAAPVVGAATGAVAARVGSNLSRGWRLLARKLDIAPGDLNRWLADFRASAGRDAAPVDVMRAHQQGAVRGVAEDNPYMAARLQEYRAGQEAQLPGRVGQAVARATPAPALPPYLRNAAGMTPDELSRAHRAAGDAVFPALRAQGAGALPQNLLGNPTAMGALRRNAPAIVPAGAAPGTLSAREKISEIMSGNVPAQPLTVGEMDTVRRQLARRSRTNDRDAETYDELADELNTWLGGLAGQRTPYGQALDEYHAAGDFVRGFEHAYKGGDRTTVGADNDALSATLSSATGSEGLRAGQAAALRNRASESVAGARGVMREGAATTTAAGQYPSILGQGGTAQLRGTLAAEQAADEARERVAAPVRVRDDAAAPGAADIASGLVYGALGSPQGAIPNFFRGALKAVRGESLSPETQRAIGGALTATAPGQQQQVIRELDTALQQNAARARLPTAGSVVTGAQVGAVMAPTAELRGALAVDDEDQWYDGGYDTAPGARPQQPDDEQWYE